MSTNECCIDAVQASEACISGCIKNNCPSCIEYCRDVADICTLSIRLSARNSKYAQQLRKLCAEVCRACAEHCGKCESDCCKKCAEACRICAEQCGK